MTSTWVRIGGVPATEIAAHTPPTYEHSADGGCTSASLAFALSRLSHPRELRPGALVEILRGPMPVWTGTLIDPDRTTWECSAIGLSAGLRDYLALDAGAATRSIAPAVAGAIADGWEGHNATPIAGTAAGDATGNPVKVGDLLDDYAEQTGQRWGVDATGVLWMRPDPTTATLMAAPGTALFGQTTERTPTRLAGRYFNGTEDAIAFSGSGAPQEAVDLTQRGTLTEVAAEAILAGALTRIGAAGWTNGVTLHREQLTTIGGQSVNLAAVTAGQMLRAQGLAYADASLGLRADVIVGKTRYTAGEDSIYLEPVNTAPRNLVDVLAAS